MRFAFLIVGGFAVGAASVGGARTMLPPTASMFDAVRALGGNPADVKIGEINPLKAYEDVARQLTSTDFRAPFDLGTPVPATSAPKFGKLSLSNGLHIDQAAMKRAMAAGASAQIQQNFRRSQDIAAYGRNPMAWHGAPPF
jgi:hypothetical protein